VVPFTLPEGRGGKKWRRLIDTNVIDARDLPDFPQGHHYEVTGRSLLLFMLEPEGRESPVLLELLQAIDAILGNPEAAI
jgi:hypothetical protein